MKKSSHLLLRKYAWTCVQMYIKDIDILRYKDKTFSSGHTWFPIQKKKNELETTLIVHNTIYILKDNDTLECAEYYQDTYRILR